jgi:hypothetical protein
MGGVGSIMCKNSEAVVCGGIVMPTLAWSPYFDPFEGGFTIEVPTGWLVDGGIIRYEIEHPAILLCAEAPDHKTYFQLGTPEPTVYQTPTFGQPESGAGSALPDRPRLRARL